MFRKSREQDQETPAPLGDIVLPVAALSREEPSAAPVREVPPPPMQVSPRAEQYAGARYVPVDAPAVEVNQGLASALLTVSLLTARTIAALVLANVEDHARHQRQLDVIMQLASRSVARGDVRTAERTLRKYPRQQDLSRQAHLRLGAALDLQARVRTVQQEALTLQDLLKAQAQDAALSARLEALRASVDDILKNRDLWSAAEAQVAQDDRGFRDSPETQRFVQDTVARLRADHGETLGH